MVYGTLKESSHIYDFLAVPKVINAAGTYTVFGGSRMPQCAITAMAQAAESFVEIAQLMRRANAYLAQITKNEAAFVTCGAAAGLYLATLACVIKKGGVPVDASFSVERVKQCEVIIHRAHRNPYDWAIAQTGVRIVDIGYPTVMFEAGFPEEFVTSVDKTIAEMRSSITPQTVAIVYTVGRTTDEGGWIPSGAIALDTVLTMAKEFEIPVIVDAAAQLPPVDNLWAFTQKGADVVIFSGGKDLRGPQATGLLLGRRELLDVLYDIACPNHGVGRMLKVGREEIAGIVAAVDHYVSLDHDARLAWCEAQIQELNQAFSGCDQVTVERAFPNEAGQPIPRAFVQLAGWNTKDVVQALYAQTPKIITAPAPEGGVFVNPMTMEAGDMAAVIAGLRRLLTGTAKGL